MAALGSHWQEDPVVESTLADVTGLAVWRIGRAPHLESACHMADNDGTFERLRSSLMPSPEHPHRLSAFHQRGMTTLGMLILVCFIGLFVFGGLRLTPVYLNYFKVSGVVTGVQQEFDGTNPTRAAIRSSIARRFDVESVSKIRASDIKVTPVDGGFEVAAVYKHETPFIANVGFVVSFDKTVVVRR
jgi:hypothetical protein